MLGELGAVERAQVEPVHPPATIELGQERAQRMPAVELVGAVGGDDHDPLGAQVAHQEREEIAGRAIRPVQILEHEQQRAVSRRAPQEAERKLEQATLRRGADRRRRPGGRLDEVRKQPGEFQSAGRQQIRAARGVESARVVAQRLDERPEREPAVLDVDAATDQRGRPGRCRRARRTRWPGGSCRPRPRRPSRTASGRPAAAAASPSSNRRNSCSRPTRRRFDVSSTMRAKTLPRPIRRRPDEGGGEANGAAAQAWV